MEGPFDEPILDPIVQDISLKGYAIVDDFLPPALVQGLRANLKTQFAKGTFHEAGIGKAHYHTVAKNIRGDHVLWIEEGTADPFEKEFLSRINAFVRFVNRTCYLGIRDVEFHYALYPVGTYYQRHLDRFQTDSRRRMSLICYLNEDWTESDGGELALYLNDKDGIETQKKVVPLAGRMVCFESDQLEHEVLAGKKERLSITGWLRNG